MRSSSLGQLAPFAGALAALALLASTSVAAAQAPPDEPPPNYTPPPPPPNPPPPAPPGYAYYLGPAPGYVPAPPAPPLSETHAPKYSLWTGARLSFLAFGFNFYDNERGNAETTGNWVGNGFAPELDVGARISYRYIPYLFWEHGFMGQGHHFTGTDAHSSSDFYGLGFRYVGGDVDEVGFITELAVGKRVISVSNGSQTYSMSGIEFFRLGLGAEIRLATLFSISPMATISSGALSDSSGDISFNCAPNCADGIQGPTYAAGRGGTTINTNRAYVALTFGVGIHFDVFGK